eukprot:2384458-Rhodomonas_salina.5
MIETKQDDQHFRKSSFVNTHKTADQSHHLIMITGHRLGGPDQIRYVSTGRRIHTEITYKKPLSPGGSRPDRERRYTSSTSSATPRLGQKQQEATCPSTSVPPIVKDASAPGTSVPDLSTECCVADRPISYMRVPDIA